jgi:KUP system potassium uptake protein
MLVTTFLMVPIMFLVWQSHWFIIFLFTGLSLLVELTYFSAVILKVDQGGWVPLVIASCFLLVMYTWRYRALKKFECEKQTKVSVAWILGLGPSLGLVKCPGIGFVYTELASGVLVIFSHLITNLPAVRTPILINYTLKFIVISNILVVLFFLKDGKIYHLFLLEKQTHKYIIINNT